MTQYQLGAWRSNRKTFFGLHLQYSWQKDVAKISKMPGAQRDVNPAWQLMGPKPNGQTCTPMTGYFHDKTKISQENLRVDYYLLPKCCKRQCTLLLPTWTKPLTIKI